MGLIRISLGKLGETKKAAKTIPDIAMPHTRHAWESLDGFALVLNSEAWGACVYWGKLCQSTKKATRSLPWYARPLTQQREGES